MHLINEEGGRRYLRERGGGFFRHALPRPRRHPRALWTNAAGSGGTRQSTGTPSGTGQAELAEIVPKPTYFRSAWNWFGHISRHEHPTGDASAPARVSPVPSTEGHDHDMCNMTCSEGRSEDISDGAGKPKTEEDGNCDTPPCLLPPTIGHTRSSLAPWPGVSVRSPHTAGPLRGPSTTSVALLRQRRSARCYRRRFLVS